MELKQCQTREQNKLELQTRKKEQESSQCCHVTYTPRCADQHTDTHSVRCVQGVSVCVPSVINVFRLSRCQQPKLLLVQAELLLSVRVSVSAAGKKCGSLKFTQTESCCCYCGAFKTQTAKRGCSRGYPVIECFRRENWQAIACVQLSVAAHPTLSVCAGCKCDK